MYTASICTIGDEILIGQIVDTNSSNIARALNSLGIRTGEMLSIGDDRQTIITRLEQELRGNDIVITTGGLGPTKDDITKEALAELSNSQGSYMHEGQMEVIQRILKSRGIEMLDINRLQAYVPDKCEVIVNKLGTAPIMVFRFDEKRFGHKCTLYTLPGVPFEAIGALEDILSDIKKNYSIDSITHGNIMTYGIAESALAKKIETWEEALPKDMHLAYLPNQLTGVKLRLSIYGGDESSNEKRIREEFSKLNEVIGDYIYSDKEDSLEGRIGSLLRGSGKTLCAAESCTGGEISHLITTVPGASEYYFGSVTSYSPRVKEKLLGVSSESIEKYGIVSSQVAAEMAVGVRKLMGCTYSVSTTGWADSYGDEFEEAGTVWVGLSGPRGTRTVRFNFKNKRAINIQRFAAAALNELRKMIEEDDK